MLTVTFVLRIRLPLSGERWIADTKLRGFGLRLWATPSGIGKAYGIRISDLNGNKIRKTYRFSKNARVTKFDSERQFASSLDSARAWAMDEIDKAKGRLPLFTERMLRRERFAYQVRRMSLEHAAQMLIEGMRIEGLSQSYLDRLDKLFMAHVPAALRQRPLAKVSHKKLAASLAKLAVHGGNLRILKSFVGQIFTRAGEFDGSLSAFPEKLSEEFWERWERTNKLPFPELGQRRKDRYQTVFAKLEAGEDRWPEACCIRLFFILGAPLSKLMSAQWWQIIGDVWYPYLPEEKKYWFESREVLNSDALAIVQKLRTLSDQLSVGDRYLFPSLTNRGKPISSVYNLWVSTLNEIGHRNYPLGEFARSYRSPNNPSYAMTTVRQYGKMFREVGNAAKVSKLLYEARDNAIKSAI